MSRNLYPVSAERIDLALTKYNRQFANTQLILKFMYDMHKSKHPTYRTWFRSRPITEDNFWIVYNPHCNYEENCRNDVIHIIFPTLYDVLPRDTWKPFWETTSKRKHNYISSLVNIHDADGNVLLDLSCFEFVRRWENYKVLDMTDFLGTGYTLCSI